LPHAVDVEPGASVRVPVTVRVAPDARDDWPIGVEIGLKGSDGSFAIGAIRMAADASAAPIAPRADSVVPEALRGGINVAWSAIGGKTEAAAASLIDGLNDAKAAPLPFGNPSTFELAGGRSQPVAGLIVTPAIAVRPPENLRRFSVSVSEDGARFNEVLEAELSPLPHEQYFVLRTPVNARFVRLAAMSNYDPAPGNHAVLSEIKVVADPKAPFGATGFDIGRPELGGHVVWAAPYPNWPINGVGARWPGGRVAFLPGRKSAPEIVLGFRANRAARVTGLTWHELADVPPAERIQVVEVAYGDHPHGPWTSLGRWETKNARLDLPAPRTMRFIDLRVIAPAEELATLPEWIGVVEAAAGPDYRSILGEWGEESRETEPMMAAAAPSATPRIGAGRSRETATALPADTMAAGTVQLGTLEDWYKVELPKPARQIRVTLTGTPAPEAAIALETAAGVPVALTVDPAAPGTYSANTRPGVYFVHVMQPPRSMIVSWDTSGSVAKFAPGIRRVVEGLSRDLEVGREEIELLPFRGEQSAPIIGKWSGERGEVYSVIAHYPWGDASSNAEAAIVAANKAFANRQGLHALAIITDAASDGAALTPLVWNGIAQNHPRIFALKVPTSDSAVDTMAEMNLMEDWGYATGGYLGLFASQGSADVHFRRMAARLRRPTAYGVSYTIGTEPLPPGYLTLSLGRTGVEASGFGSAIELVIDASGSMLQRIGGQTKIDIEKALLVDLTSHDLPAGTPVAIRVFGQGGKDSCRSDLVQSLAPLDRAKAAGAIANIRSTNGAKTAIADSLRVIPADLEKARGERIIVLVTDGEETCGGDPRAEIEKLREAGLDVFVNIVGFSVDNAVTRAQFQEWATLGGGQYFDSSDSATLDAALRNALLPGVDITTPAGEPVGHTTLGAEPLELAAGRYLVRRTGASAEELGSVEITAGATTQFEIRR
jgi:hypothetical protein